MTTSTMTLAVIWMMALLEGATIAHLGAVVAFAVILLFQGKELREIRKNIV